LFDVLRRREAGSVRELGWFGDKLDLEGFEPVGHLKPSRPLVSEGELNSYSSRPLVVASGQESTADSAGAHTIRRFLFVPFAPPS
jgi:hypothetical protein